MSDTEKIEPCAWCGNQPVEKQHSSFPERVDRHCGCGLSQTYASTAWEWNAWQVRIMAQRRGDFEWGIVTAYSRGISDTWLCEHQDLTCSELRDKIWNDYIKTTAEKGD